MAKQQARVSVLEGLMQRTRDGEVLREEEVQRELEMVGLRERTVLTRHVEDELAIADVGWWEVIFGKKRQRNVEEEEKKAIDEWAQSRFQGLSAYLANRISRHRGNKPFTRSCSAQCRSRTSRQCETSNVVKRLLVMYRDTNPCRACIGRDPSRWSLQL
jgi:hypothetical protein